MRVVYSFGEGSASQEIVVNAGYFWRRRVKVYKFGKIVHGIEE